LTTPGSVLALVGVTASGKSALALELARRHHDIELVSIDSMQIYRRMDIGTAKPTLEEQAEVRHHLLDLVEPWEEFTVSEFQAAAQAAIADIEARGCTPVLVGGTGLHLRAVVDALEMPPQYPEVRAALDADGDTEALHRRLAELDPVAAGRMEPTNRRRVVRALEVTLGSGRPFSSFGPGLESYGPTRFRLVGIRRPRPSIDERIVARYREQMHVGFLAEVRHLADDPRGVSRTAAQALGYRQLFAHVAGDCDLVAALDDAVTATKRFARRQERWFRRDPRIAWIDVAENPMETLDEVVRQWRA
jgi:tRNA dimethylallyltransferase